MSKVKILSGKRSKQNHITGGEEQKKPGLHIDKAGRVFVKAMDYDSLIAYG